MSKGDVVVAVLAVDPNVSIRIERLSIPEPNTGCYLWLGKLDDNGYARITGYAKTIGLCVKEERSSVRVSRVILARKLGRMPVGLALHTCDMPCCVNEDHLYEGSRYDNSKDIIKRNRMSKNSRARFFPHSSS